MAKQNTVFYTCQYGSKCRCQYTVKIIFSTYLIYK